MSLELLNTLFSCGTLIVVAATAAAAVVQLRHLRTSNQIAALNELRETMETPSFKKAGHFVAAELQTKLQDSEFRRQLVDRSSRTDETRPFVEQTIEFGNFYELFGALMKAGFVEKELGLEIWNGLLVENWKMMEPVVALLRRKNEGSWENFEYAAVLAQDWRKAHPGGSYPPAMRRMQVTDVWLEADAALSG